MNALDVMKALFAQYGLPDSLITWAEEALRNPEMTEDRLLLEMRQTPEYAIRFPAMAELQKRGRAISESEYIDYEQTIASLAQQYALPEEMFTPEYIKNMLVADVSAREFDERAGLAAQAARQAPPEFRAAFEQMYGMGSSGALNAYFLDPDEALPVVQRRFEAAQIGGESLRYGFAIQADTLERLASQGYGQEEARRAYSTADRLRRLAGGFGETIGEQNLVSAQFDDTEAQKAQRRVQGSRTGQFEGGGGTSAEGQGVSALGGSSA